MNELRGKRVTVAGLGRFGGGIEVSRWLISRGANLLVTDKDPAEKLAESVAQLSGLPIEFRFGEHLESDFTQTDLIVTSPAVPPTSPYLQAAKSAGVPITTEIRLFIEQCPAPVLGVTGTKGKSTASAMLQRMLESKFTAWLGGNIGGSLLEKLPEISAEHFVVLELSSYMLEHLRAMQWSPHVAVVTMLAIDHVEWHGSADAYLDAKRNIVRFQKPDDFAVLDLKNADAKYFAQATAARIIDYGKGDRRAFELRVAGAHNQLNAQAAFAAAEVLGISWTSAQSALRDFTGLPHRLELVWERDGVRYINDSIATIPQAAVAALESFPAGRVIQIIGGSDKHLAIDSMCKTLSRRAKAVLCIGETGPFVASALRQSNGSAIIHECGDMPRAMKIAGQLATAGDVVLLSTGYASYDQFTNFQARGEAFAKLARG